jgi:hypothetical protein
MKIQLVLYGAEALRAIRLLEADDARRAAEAAAAKTVRERTLHEKVLAALPVRSKNRLYPKVGGSRAKFYAAVAELLASGEIVQTRDGLARPIVH